MGADGADKEHKMSILQGIRLYPKAIGFAAGIAMACAMEGYQICLIGNYYAFPPFNEKYGELQPDGTYQVPARWQSGLSNLAQCGQIIGLLSEWIWVWPCAEGSRLDIDCSHWMGRRAFRL